MFEFHSFCILREITKSKKGHSFPVLIGGKSIGWRGWEKEGSSMTKSKNKTEMDGVR